ncbi:MAG: peptidyl-prolyl cis-trans isomerase [Acidobacteria bacterium]|nr:peptidyl-prolyl cis-trans isomerase [Acidobacteriota bacterium]
MDDALFALKPGGFSAPVTVPQGLAVLSLADVRAPQPSPFETVKGRVEADLRKSRSRAKARTTAAEIVGASGTLSARVEKKKLEVKSLPQINRSQPAPPITEAAKAAAFAATVGSVLGPYDSDDGLLILAVKAKTPATPDQAAADRATLKRRMLDEDRASLYQALLARLEKTSTIDVNEGLLRKRTQG